MMGLPVIGIDWGGQSLLVTPGIAGIPGPADQRGRRRPGPGRGDGQAFPRTGELADTLGKAGRAIALERRASPWSDLIQQWIAIYHEYGLPARRGRPPPGAFSGEGISLNFIPRRPGPTGIHRAAGGEWPTSSKRPRPPEVAKAGLKGKSSTKAWAGSMAAPW